MGKCILDMMLDNQRLIMLSRMCKAYKPHLELSWVINELCLQESNESEAFLRRAGSVIVSQWNEDEKKNELVIVTKDSVIDQSVVLTQEKLLL